MSQQKMTEMSQRKQQLQITQENLLLVKNADVDLISHPFWWPRRSFSVYFHLW